MVQIPSGIAVWGASTSSLEGFGGEKEKTRKKHMFLFAFFFSVVLFCYFEKAGVFVPMLTSLKGL